MKIFKYKYSYGEYYEQTFCFGIVIAESEEEAIKILNLDEDDCLEFITEIQFQKGLYSIGMYSND